MTPTSSIRSEKQLPEIPLNSNSFYSRKRSSVFLASVRTIWSLQEVASSLKSLPGGETLWWVLGAERMLLENVGEDEQDEAQWATTATIAVEEAVAAGYGETALLISALCSLPNLILKLLEECSIDACAKDHEGRTPLHLTCCTGDETSVALLLRYGAKFDMWDLGRKATPLHCAACAGSVECIKLLLDAGADVNIGFSEGCSAILYAVQVNSVKCVEKLLEAGASSIAPTHLAETPLHLAAAFGFSDCIRVLLAGGSDVRALYGPTAASPLHLAAREGYVECVRLLIEAGTDPNMLNCRKQTPLHLAALAQSTDTMEVLLKCGADPNAPDDQQRTPLHCAIVKEARTSDCVKLLLVRGANVNCSDIFGYAPLHIAALNEFSTCVGMLINAGADVMSRTNGGVSALTFVVRRTPEALLSFFEKLDSSLTLNDRDIGDPDCEIRLDFRMLLPPTVPDSEKIEKFYQRRVESALLLGFIEVGMRHLLKHPLCETFLYLKWKRIKKYFLISLAYQLLFIAFYTTYTIGVFSVTHPEVTMSVDTGLKAVGYILMMLSVVFLAKEVFGAVQNQKKYIFNWENWIKWIVLVSVFVCYGAGNNNLKDLKEYQYHVAAIGIVFAWADLMIMIGRFPAFGVYIQMFTTVSINFSKFLFAYCCLEIGFGLSFSVLLSNSESFNTPYFALLKTFIMMSGELEYKEIFFPDSGEAVNKSVSSPNSEIKYPGTAHILFLVFVILVTVILINLLVGLAVSDIQGLQKRARLNRLVRQTELVAHIESVLFSHMLHRIFPSAFLKPYLRSALMVSSTPYNRFIYIRPNDPRERRIPRHLIDSAYNLVASRSGRKTREVETGPASRRNAYKSWAVQYSLKSYAYSDDDDTEPGSLEGQVPVMEFLSSQISALAAEMEVRESLVEDLRNQMTEMRNSMNNLTEILMSQQPEIRYSIDSSKKCVRMKSEPIFRNYT